MLYRSSTMNSCVHSPWKQFGLRVLIMFALSTWGTDNSHAMAIAAEVENLENLITNTSGLTPQEESLLIKTIEELISNNEKTWYPQGFTSPDYSLYPSDGQRVVQLKSIADTGMNVIERVDNRLKEMEEEKRRGMGRWGFLETMDDTPYRISTNSPELVLEIQKYDCLNNEGMFLPSNLSKDVSGSVWKEYSDSVYVPFNCPTIYDFNREKEAKEYQRLTARFRRQRRSVNSGDSFTIIQVNLTLTSESFNETLYDPNTDDYLNLSQALIDQIDPIFTDHYNEVNYFSYRPGSVIATFHINTTHPNPAVFVRTTFTTEIGDGTLGTLNVSALAVGEFVFENAHYSEWGAWSACSKTCGYGSHSRSRYCNSTVPLACAHLGLTTETDECYEEYCSDGCQRSFTSDRGNFSSPVDNDLYPRNADCVWRISVDVNHTIVVQFEQFNLERDKKCKYDYVAFYDGNYESPQNHADRELLRFCGNSTPPHSYPPYGYPVNSSSNSITVRFKTDSSKERTGFTAIWHKVLRYDLRIPKIKPQYVSTLTYIYNPWSTFKDAAIPLGKATTCPKSWGDDSCYFPWKQTVISRIISVFLNRDMQISTSDPVVLKFEHILDETIFPGAYSGRKTCVTWDHSITSPKFGAWTKRGCTATYSNLTHTVCKCIHPGMFAVLGESEPPSKELHLKANVYLGCAVFVILVIATIHSLATKEKKTTGELFHLFEAVSSGILMIIFLTGAHVPAQKEFCGFLAFFLYYLLLSQFTWMLLTVFWMQNFLKRLLSDKVRIKLVYFVLGWGVPLLIAGVAGKIDIDKNGHEDNACWVSIGGLGSVWGYGAPVFAMFIANVCILLYLLLPIVKDQFHHDKLRPRIVKEFLIMLSFILTWCLGVKVILADSFYNQYFFCIFLVLQGALNYNVGHEATELFWKTEESKAEKEDGNDDRSETTEKDQIEQTEEKEKENEHPRMTVKTLKNLNIYKENGVFVIEA